MKGEEARQTIITAKSVADHLVAKLNARLNYTPSDKPMFVEDGGIFQKLDEELETNNFPPNRPDGRLPAKKLLHRFLNI